VVGVRISNSSFKLKSIMETKSA